MGTLILALIRVKHDKFARTIVLLSIFNIVMGLLAINLQNLSEILISIGLLFMQQGVEIVRKIILLSIYLLTICFLILRHIYYFDEYYLLKISGFQMYELYLTAIWENSIILLISAFFGTSVFIFCIYLMGRLEIPLRCSLDFSFYLKLVFLVFPSSFGTIITWKRNNLQ